MSGFGTHEKFGILEMCRGINLDTYPDFKSLVEAAAYKLCAIGNGDTAELQAICDRVVAQVKQEWAPSALYSAETYATKAAFEAFVRELQRPDIGDEANDMTEADYVLDLVEDGWPDCDLWTKVWCRLKDGGELTAREREQAVAYHRAGEDDVPEQFRLPRGETDGA